MKDVSLEVEEILSELRKISDHIEQSENNVFKKEWLIKTLTEKELIELLEEIQWKIQRGTFEALFDAFEDNGAPMRLNQGFFDHIFKHFGDSSCEVSEKVKKGITEDAKNLKDYLDAMNIVIGKRNSK